MFQDADINGDGLISLDEWNVLHQDSLTNMLLKEEPKELAAKDDQALLVLSDQEEEPVAQDETQEEVVEEAGAEPEEDSEWELDVVFFAFFSLFCGQILKQLSGWSGIPYTSLITVFGIILGSYEHSWGRFGEAIHLWS